MKVPESDGIKDLQKEMLGKTTRDAVPESYFQRQPEPGFTRGCCIFSAHEGQEVAIICIS